MREKTAAEIWAYAEKLRNDLIQWLIMYEWSTGRPYPRLHPFNIFYNIKDDFFGLEPDPVILEALAYERPIVTLSNCQNALQEVEMNHQFSLLDEIVADKNACKLMLCMRYLLNKGNMDFLEDDYRP